MKYTFPCWTILLSLSFFGSPSLRGQNYAITKYATLSTPYLLTVDSFGSLYVYDDATRAILKVTSAGIISTIAGNGGVGNTAVEGVPATSVSIDSVQGLAVDHSGNLYFNSWYGIRKINAAGIISNYAGSLWYRGFSGDGGPATASLFNAIGRIATDAAGNLFICDAYNNRIRKVSTAGIITTIAGTGVAGFSGDGGAATAAKLDTPGSIATDNAGNIFLTTHSRIRKINASGMISTIAGTGIAGYNGDGIQATAAQVNKPPSLAVDRNGNLIMSDAFNYRIRAINNVDGKINTIIGNGVWGSALGGFGVNTNVGPWGIATDAFNNIYFTHVNFVVKAHWCMSGRFYLDGNSNCALDTDEVLVQEPSVIRVDSNGIAIDVISASSGFSYETKGLPGDVYTFTILSHPADIVLSCPSSGVFTDTVQSSYGNYHYKEIGFQCTTSGFDLAINYARIRATLVNARGNIYVANNSCTVSSAVVTMDFSPKYVYLPVAGYPAPSTVSGSTVTWNLPGLSDVMTPTLIPFILSPSSLGGLAIHDTLQWHLSITPVTGDSNPANNFVIVVDTIRYSFDPNEMIVSPADTVSPGALLEYTIGFENTGNDTAFNISIIDSLPGSLAPASLRILSSSANMSTTMLHCNGRNILKFDFPNINLLDSSHHGSCDGYVKFTLNADNSLPPGTIILNHAGIYFDGNSPVITNTVENIIGQPNSLPVINKVSQVNIFPNPANDMLTINTGNADYSGLIITNNLGEHLSEIEMKGKQMEVDIAALPNGLYFLILKGQKEVKVEKFIKM